MPEKHTNEKVTASMHFSRQVLKPRRIAKERLVGLRGSQRKVSTSDFLACLTASPKEYSTFQVLSVSWVKALASNMSHEFIQFIVHDTATNTRHRFITDRQETGDWVISTSGFAAGDIEVSNPFSWSSLSPYKDRHDLPLPLLSLAFGETKPSLSKMAELLHNISHSSPLYSPAREHCWWYAEVVFMILREQFGGKLREWPWAKYRYSFILYNTRWLKRARLVQEAKSFEQQCLKHMIY
jgi:hypothetical protein